MKNIIYAMSDLFKNFFNWHGRLSRKSYGWTWAGILTVNAALILIRKSALFLALFSRYSYDELLSEITAYPIVIWNAMIFFPLLFATMRRYHDSGTAGWKVILFIGLGIPFLLSGFLIGSLVAIAFLFAGGYMVTAEASPDMTGLLGFAVLSVFLLLFGAGFTILNIKYLLQPSDPAENAYGKRNSLDNP